MGKGTVERNTEGKTEEEGGKRDKGVDEEEEQRKQKITLVNTEEKKNGESERQRLSGDKKGEKELIRERGVF